MVEAEADLAALFPPVDTAAALDQASAPAARLLSARKPALRCRRRLLVQLRRRKPLLPLRPGPPPKAAGRQRRLTEDGRCGGLGCTDQVSWMGGGSAEVMVH